MQSARARSSLLIPQVWMSAVGLLIYLALKSMLVSEIMPWFVPLAVLAGAALSNLMVILVQRVVDVSG